MQTLLLRTFSSAIEVSPVLAAVKLTESSGTEVPKDMMVSPIMIGFTLKSLASSAVPSTSLLQTIVKRLR
ncbi:MAG: hypothetical protein MK132_24805 [Lentisphaerales bacterium]|nr:hypothetical protein [Lentisphaerales bacterium]